MNIHHTGILVSAALALYALSQPVKAELPEYHIFIQNHAFEPANVKIPANSKVILVVENLDDSREEFESDSLQQEKVIKPKARKKIYIGPLTPGEYTFFGDFHPRTARGVVVVE